MWTSKQKHTTGSLTHTHTPATATTKKQLGTSHCLLLVIWLVETLLSCAKFWPLQVIKTKIYFCWHWTGCGDARRLCSSEGMFQAFALVWQTAQMHTFTKLGEPTIRAACTPRTILDQHFWCLFCFTSIGPSSSWAHCTPTKNVPTLCYTHRHLVSAVCWISEDCLLVMIKYVFEN